ncbi:SAE2 C-terminal domain-containing protein [Aspergillus undulatus]|uniref:SAE2 C-terminal domain-containing protein n=1 Tax=Aspergillus undulatus TaxID=1810928 RepID=UPI003CCDD623
MYEPQRVFHQNFSKIHAADFQRISDRYFELYEQAGVLIQASSELKKRVKRYRKKVAFLQAHPERQASTPAPNPRAVEPQRFEDVGAATLTANPLRAPVGGLETNVLAKEQATPTSEDVRQQDGSSAGGEKESRIENQQHEAEPELTSTLSGASTGNPELPPNTTWAPFAHPRTLKRKRAIPEQTLRTGAPSFENSAKGFPARPNMVKSETLSSSPLQSHVVHPGPAGTQDLDDVGDAVVTPTKIVRYRDHHPFQEPPSTLQDAVRLPSIHHMMHHNATPGGDQFTPDSSRVLRPIDSNLRVPGGTNQVPNKGRARNLGSISRISSITEDGDENRPPEFARRKGIETPHSHRNVRSPSSGHRLSDLLEGTSPASRTLHLRAADNAHTPTQTRTSYSTVRGSSLVSRAGTDTTSTAARTPLKVSRVAHRTSQRKVTPATIPHQTNRMTQMEVTPDDEPYRARPLQRLGLGHFKINPAYNHGLDYAYDEVIRKKDERKCVSGCTRPGCCGEKFTAMARFGIPIDASGNKMSDNEILEEYLGGDKSAVDMLSPKNREDLLVEAKAKVFADRLGKHRHQHHRSGTPPGFWRTEMPGTQELEDDHEEAQRLERDKVKERYREAMRPDGRWIFADE